MHDLNQTCRRLSTRKRRKGKPSLKALSKSGRNNARQPLAPISAALKSPKVKQQIFDRLLAFQKDAQSVLMPQFLKDGPSLGQRERRVVVMDANWWLWNIAMACTPGILISIVCQYFKSDMQEFYRKQQLLEGNDVNENEGHNNMEEEEENDPSRKANSVWTLQSSSMWNKISEVFPFQQKNDEEDNAADLNGHIDIEDDANNVQRVAPFHNIPTEVITHTPILLQTAQSEPSAQDLMIRIEALENQIQEFKENNSTSSRNRNTPERPSRRSGSNIEKRIHRNQKRTSQSDNEAKDDNAIAERSNLDMLMTFATNNLQEKREAVLNAGQQLRQKLEDQCGITPATKEGDSVAQEPPRDDSMNLAVSTEPSYGDEESSNYDAVTKKEDSPTETDINAKGDVNNRMHKRWFQRLPFFGNRNKNDK